MTSTFDAETFLNVETDAAIDTKIIPIPMGEHLSQIEAVKPKKVTTKDGERIVLDVIWSITSEEAKKATGIDKPTVRQGVFIDLNDNGAIDMTKGKNRQLGLIREATGQNKDGKPWKPSDLVGQMATLVITHNPDENDPDIIYSNVKKVLAA